MKLFLVAVLFSFVAVFTDTAIAQETKLVVTPAIIDAPAQSGEVTTRKLQITNTNDFPLPINIEVQSAVIDGEPLDKGSRERFDVSDWIRFAEETYLFDAGQSKEIPFTITPPFTALAGGHYAQISIRGLAIEQSQLGQKGLVFPEIGIPVLVTIPGEIIEDARVANGSIFPTTMTAEDSQNIKIPVENTGTVHNLVSGKIIIERRGEVVFEQAIQPGIVLPSTRKFLRQEWTSPRLGKYVAYVQLQFGTQNKTVRSEVERFYVTPPLYNLAWLAIFTWIAAYLLPRRHNIMAAVRVAIK